MTESAVVETLLHGYGLSGDEGSVGFCGVYLVRSAGPHVLFDTGHAGRRRALLRALDRRGLAPADIDVVVLSHAHYDHLQNADLFTRVLLHPAESRRLATAPTDDPVIPPWSAAILSDMDVQSAGGGTVVAPGVTVVALPGHTEGSLGLTVHTAEGVAVLTGDAVSSARALRLGRCTAVGHDAQAAARSLALVAATADIVYPGHDRPFRVRAGRPEHYLEPPVPL